MRIYTVDFETQAIEPRPKYPPEPVGVAIMEPGGRSRYYAWGHPTGNNCTKLKVKAILRDIWKSGSSLLFHNAKFDLAVAEKFFGLALPPWERIHDTMFLLALDNPHAPDFKLKPSAERLLGMPPEERDAVKDWLVAHGVITKAQDAGAYIARAPGDLVGKYAVGDVVRTRKLFDMLYKKICDDVPENDASQSMADAYERERRLLPILLANESAGMYFDVERAAKDIPVFQRAMEQAEAWLRKKLKAPGLDFEKDRDVGEALAATKIVTDFVMTKRGQRSVAKKNLTVDKFHDREVFRVLGYRNRLQTVLSLNLIPWAKMAESTGKIYTEWNQVRRSSAGGDTVGARSGRISCSRFMNVSKDFYDKGDGYEHPTKIDVPELPLVRRYCLPDPGQIFGHVDYSQQEFRILAHYEDGAMKAAYLANPRIDYHDSMKQRVKEILSQEYARRLIKALNFSINYGAGAPKLAEMAHCDLETAKRLKAAAREAVPDVIALNRMLMDKFKAGQPIRTWGGRLFYCEPPGYSDKFKRDMTYEYKALNYLIQGSAADCTKEAIIRYHERRADIVSRMVVTVHDEINISCPKKAYAYEIRKLQEVMESIEFDVPMLTDAEYGPSWGELTSLEIKEAA